MARVRGRVRWIRYTALATLLALAWAAWPLGASWDALRLMGALAGVEALTPEVTPRVEREDVTFTASGAEHPADWYTTPGRVRAGLVLAPGAAPDGRRDARLVEFATLLAAFDFGVFVPDVPSFRELRPSPDSVAIIAAAHARLEEQLGDDAGGRGIGAFSLAAGPAVLAALEDPPDFMVLIGGYHDLERTLRFLTTGDVVVDGEHRRATPDAYGKWVYALANARRLEERPERAALEALARRRMADPAAPVEELVARLGADGRAVFRFVENTDPARFDALLAALPQPVRDDIAALDLAHRDLSSLTGETVLVHGYDDEIIPFTESVSLAGALPEDHVHLALLNGLAHVDRDLRIADAWTLWRALRVLMAQRD